jgi:hypothetical protein
LAGIIRYDDPLMRQGDNPVGSFPRLGPHRMPGMVFSALHNAAAILF